MLVREGDRTCLEAPAKAEPADSVVTPDYYTQLPQIRLTANSSARSVQPNPPIEVMLDGNDVAKLVECAIRHPAPNMRHPVLASIWSHAESFRQIFRFGLEAPEAFSEVRRIVAEELKRCRDTLGSPASNRVTSAAEPLLPRMPLPAHLRNRERQ